MNYKKILILLFFIAIFVYMMAINFYMPLWADDWSRPATNSNIINVLKYVYTMYFSWSGCVLPMFFIGLFPLKNALNIGIFNILNALFFIALIYVIFFLIYSRKPKSLNDLAVLILIFSLIWFMPIAFGEVVLWKMVTSGILWSITATLVFIYPYKRLLENKSKMPDNPISKTVFFIVGILLSTCVQNLALTVSILLVSILCYKKLKKNTIFGWAYTGVGGYLIGTIVSMVAPGNYVRLKAVHVGAYFHLSFLQKIFMLSGQIALHFSPFVILYLLIIFILRRKFKQKNNYNEELKWFCFFLALALLSAVIIGGAPAALFYGRITFVSDVFAIIAAVCLMPMENKGLFKKVIWSLLILVILPLQIFDMVKTYKFYHQLHDQIAQREALIQLMAQHNKDLAIAPIYFSRQLNTFNISGDINKRRFFASDITPDSAKGASTDAKIYYHLNSIKLVSDLVFGDTLSKIKTDLKLPFTVTLRDNKIYYINTKIACDKIQNKQGFLLKVYPKNWFANKLYTINEIFYLHDKRSKIRDVLITRKNPFYLLDLKLWFNWRDLKSDFNDFSFTWTEAKRATVLTKDFRPVNNMCVIVDYLPDYPIDHIETGQVKDGKLLWKTIVQPVAP